MTSPDEEKNKVVPSKEEVATTGGFQPFRTSSVGEAYKRGAPVPDEWMKYYWQPGNNYSPNPEFRRISDEYYKAIAKLSPVLVDKILQSIRTEFGDFDPLDLSSLVNGRPIVACNLYPEVEPAKEAEFRVAFHRDLSLVTALHQIPAQNGHVGLSLKVKDGAIIPIPAIKGAFLVNVGEVFQYVTNGLLDASEHGVLLSNDVVGSERAT